MANGVSSYTGIPSGYDVQTLYAMQKYLQNNGGYSSVPISMEQIQADGYYPSGVQNKEADDSGLGFVGWTTILGGTAALVYAAKKGKLNGVIDWVKGLFGKGGKEAIENGSNTIKGKLNGVIDWVKGLFGKGGKVAETGASGIQAEKVAKTVKGKSGKKAAEAMASGKQAGSAAKKVKGKSGKKAAKKSTPMQNMIDASLPERQKPLTGAARQAKEKSYEKLFNAKVV